MKREARLTAYALGELSADERAEVERWLAEEPELAAFVDEVRATAGLLEEGLRSEPAAALREEQRAAIAAIAAGPPARRVAGAGSSRNWLALATAAGMLAALGVWTFARVGGDQEVELTEAPAAGSEAAAEAREELAAIRGLGYVGGTGSAPQRRPEPEERPGLLSAPEKPEALEDLHSGPGGGAGGNATRSEVLTLDPKYGRDFDAEVAQGAAVDHLTADPDSEALAKRNAEGVAEDVRLALETLGYSGAATVPGHPKANRLPEGAPFGVPDEVSVWRSDPVPVDDLPVPGTESYQRLVENTFHDPRRRPLSTFSVDVDTASYANVRRFLNEGRLPPPDAVRIEELVNYFAYDYPEPEGAHPFAVDVEVGTCPWSPGHRLLRIGLQGAPPVERERKRVNLIFLIDVSGSMDEPAKLPLVKDSLRLLADELTENDSIAIVTYAGEARLHLARTHGANRDALRAAIDALSAGGSTNGESGIELAYRLASEGFVEGGVNRVLLATDGDFNVGQSSDAAMVRLIEEKARTGVHLSVLGFGTGNLKDSKLEGISGRGNGNYAYVDGLREAKRVLVDGLAGTLETIAEDVKLQVDFNPARVASYRLVGYENRALAARDFADDTKDAGEIGAGHRVTALYEIAPAGGAPAGVAPSKYAAPDPEPPGEPSDELCEVRLRYQPPGGGASTELRVPVTDAGLGFRDLSDDTRFAAAVAAFGMVLRGSPYRGAATAEAAGDWARDALGADPRGHRAELCDLVRRARELE